MTRSCGDGVKEMNGRVDILPLQRILKFHSTLEESKQNTSTIAPAVYTEQVKKAHIKITRKNYKFLMKEIKESTNKWEDILCSQIGMLNIVKMPILSKEIQRANAISIKTPMVFFTETGETI